ncbi:MAG: hypothetical protein DME55_13610 [Verrucomicrobia bacterium]|nr:MAG: hypothetical protein DME55_13610 [Verrucomicrobiota bacterium]
MIVVEKSAFCWHGICGILHDYTFLRRAMQSNAVSRDKFLLLCMAFCGAMLAPSHDAKAVALGVGDSHELGFLWPGIQRKTDNQNKATYVSHLIGMALGAIDVANGEVYPRSNHGFKSLPTAARAINGGGRTINLRTGGLYTYLFATYDAYGSEVWYIGNLSGIITIPFLAAGHYLTGWTLFGPRGVGVPDGGITVMLLGATCEQCKVAVVPK